ncbi:two-component system sensor histidine kinase CreC [Pontiella agarivorans]|uniref:histidine kinase n=1 Tax=Pontiella agarivorans TaxID=3038953 RepID=A0ABU5MVH0_9BACT|nr:two-component system sensor histidine kinase CreC [Pontiella agarivorans]MDZ8118108.1 two-component system sensor histidine kinase CreC [Pontiella agarivorans]
MKMRSRLLLTAVLLLSIGFYWLVDWIVRDVRLHYFITMEESLADTSVLLAEQLAGGGGTRPDFEDALVRAREREIAARIYNHTKTNMNLRVVVVDAGSRTVFDSRGDLRRGARYDWRDATLALRGEYGARTTYENPYDAYSTHMYVAAPILSGEEIVGAVAVGKPLVSVTPFMKSARLRLVVSGLAGFTAIVLLLIPVSLWIIQPVRALTRYARAVRDGRKAQRPKLGHGGEMSELADAFEEMRDALEGKQYVEEYVQSLTHEMKSPLAAIQGAAELLDEKMSDEQRRRFLLNIKTESERLHGLVERMLALAAIEKRKELELHEYIDLQVLLEDVADSLLPVAQAKEITIRTSVSNTDILKGDYFLLRQALMNLVMNAIDFSPLNRGVEVAASESQITVKDEGGGIPAYALCRVFERFYSLPRPDGGAKSSGLGLNFVREIARLHGGDVELNNRPEGGVEAVLRWG